MSTSTVLSRYRAYIDSINSNTMETELSKYCHSQVVHNEIQYTLDEYRQLIQDSKDRIAHLHFHIEILLFDSFSQKLAIRLLLSGTPIQSIDGIPPNGNLVHFSENVFYQLVDGKISQVWSLVDWKAVHSQLS